MSSVASARADLISLVSEQLVGPRAPNEILTESPQSRYIIGQLAPEAMAEIDAPEELDDPSADDLAAINSGDVQDGAPPDEGTREATTIGAARRASLSSIGIAFVVPASTRLSVSANWGEYQQTPDGAFQRIPQSADLEIAFTGPCNLTAKNCGRAELRWVARTVGNLLLCSVFFVNATPELQVDGTDRLFQVCFSLRGANGNRPFLTRDQIVQKPHPEIEDLLYRNRREFAVGLNCAVIEGDIDEAGLAAGELRTATMPVVEAWSTVAQPFDDTDLLSMTYLARARNAAELVDRLRKGFRGYSQWAANLEKSIESLEPALRPLARSQITEIEKRNTRLESGLARLADTPTAFASFIFANECMARSRFRTSREPGPLEAPWDDALGGKWYPFQLAFLISQIPDIVDETDPNRGLVDVLFFPTGGGKTEAYLGVAAFAMAWRRLSGQLPYGGAGVTVLMRYTLRLLTNQQFSRAASVVAAAELLRQHGWNIADLGHVPFSIGLWVGPMTPSTYQTALENLADARRAHGKCDLGCDLSKSPKDAPPLREDSDKNFMVLTECPWCGSKLCVSSIRELKSPDRVEVVCQRAGCPFSASGPIGRLPVWFVDSDVYRECPTILIGTVDKFATLPYRGEAKAIFGLVDGYCKSCGFTSDASPHRKRCGSTGSSEGATRGADLVIQDELHTITDNIGSVYGLYETALEFLARRGTSLQKYIAATATVKNVDRQIYQLYGGRRAAVFPPVGLDAGDTFFSRDAAPSSDLPGRAYVGVYAPTKSRLTTFVAVLSSLLASAWRIREIDGETAADSFLTLIGYFNTIRDLGAVKSLLADDVPPVLKRISEEERWSERVLENFEDELTGRVESGEVPQRLALLGRKFSEGSACDFMACTNMISVGVDVPRLGLMMVDGQPKSTAEYIQATSRVGRSSPGLVFAVYNAMRPRDVSHYEHFYDYHRSYYRFVEAGSVTPFSDGCVSRYFPGAFVSGFRLSDAESGNDGAERFKLDELGLSTRLGGVFSSRAKLFGQHESETVTAAIDELTSSWALCNDRLQYTKPVSVTVKGKKIKVKSRPGGRAVISPPEERNEQSQLPQEERALFTAPRSMRNVEATVPLRVRGA